VKMMEAWRNLSRRPSLLPPVALQLEPTIHEVVGLARDGQRTLRSRGLTGELQFGSRDPIAQAAMDSLGSAERFWRLTAMSNWARLLATPSPPGATPVLVPACFRLEAVAPRDWSLFWLKKVVGQRLPLMRFVGLVEREQLRFKITSGNAIDRMHAARLLYVDRLITCDESFHSVLSAVSESLGVRGRSVLIRQSAPSAVAELARIL
jgi:hypothetical protein